MGRLDQSDAGRKPIAEVSSGSVSIPIYESPVTIRTGKQTSALEGSNPQSGNGDSPSKTYPSFKIVYYEGKQRVFRRRNTLVKAKALAKELAGVVTQAVFDPCGRNG